MPQHARRLQVVHGRELTIDQIGQIGESLNRHTELRLFDAAWAVVKSDVVPSIVLFSRKTATTSAGDVRVEAVLQAEPNE